MSTTYALTTHRGSYKIRSNEALPTEGWARILILPDGTEAIIVINGEPYEIEDVDGNLSFGEHFDPTFRVVAS
jgi:hypothetical protein